jgi:hypothetical protein
MNAHSIRPPADLPAPYVTVIALHEARWVLAIWTGLKWVSQGKTITATRWLPCVVSRQRETAGAA